jgi:hypothetical protein
MRPSSPRTPFVKAEAVCAKQRQSSGKHPANYTASLRLSLCSIWHSLVNQASCRLCHLFGRFTVYLINGDNLMTRLTSKAWSACA